MNETQNSPKVAIISGKKYNGVLGRWTNVEMHIFLGKSFDYEYALKLAGSMRNVTIKIKDRP